MIGPLAGEWNMSSIHLMPFCHGRMNWPCSLDDRPARLSLSSHLVFPRLPPRHAAQAVEENKMKSMLVNVQDKGPVSKAKSGKFDVSIWHWKRITPQPEATKDLFPEKEIDVHRACIRFSRYNRETQTWDETTIWCRIADLGDLKEALDNLSDQL